MNWKIASVGSVVLWFPESFYFCHIICILKGRHYGCFFLRGFTIVGKYESYQDMIILDEQLLQVITKLSKLLSEVLSFKFLEMNHFLCRAEFVSLKVISLETYLHKLGNKWEICMNST